MEIDTSILMLFSFIILLVISVLKIYAFLPNEQLADDDTTDKSKNELLKITLHVIKNSNENLSKDELFEKIINDDSFSKERYWRFNKNRLNQLLESYYLKHPHTKSIADIYKDIE